MVEGGRRRLGAAGVGTGIFVVVCPRSHEREARQTILSGIWRSSVHPLETARRPAGAPCRSRPRRAPGASPDLKAD